MNKLIKLTGNTLKNTTTTSTTQYTRSFTTSNSISSTTTTTTTLDSTTSTPPPIASTSTTTTTTTTTEPIVEETTAEVEEVEEEIRGGSKKLPSKGYRNWLNNDGARYRNGLTGQTNWLGDTPFPLNPTFSPLPPLSDVLKTQIFKSYNANINLPNSKDELVVRALSMKFGIEMMRIRAVIRLKEFEFNWVNEGKALQTNLLKGMESHLGVKPPGPNFKGIESPLGPIILRAGKKTIFEMIDEENNDDSVFLPLLSTPLPIGSTTTSSTTNGGDGGRVKGGMAKIKIVPASNSARAATRFKDVSKTWEGRIMKESYETGRLKQIKLLRKD